MVIKLNPKMSVLEFNLKVEGLTVIKIASDASPSPKNCRAARDWERENVA